MSAVDDVARNAEGKIVERICDENGEEIISIRCLPNDLIAVDVTGDDALSLAKNFLPKTMIGEKTLATGKMRWRFVYRGGAP